MNRSETWSVTQKGTANQGKYREVMYQPGANYRTAEIQCTVQASENCGLEEGNKRGLRLLAGRHRLGNTIL